MKNNKKLQLTDKLKSISYSNMSTYLDCPRKWKLNYIDKKTMRSESIDLFYGTAMHEAVQEYLKEYYGTTIADLSLRRGQVIEHYIAYFIERFLYNFEQSKKRDPNLKVTSSKFQEYIEFGMETLKEFIPNTQKYFPKRNFELYGIQTDLLLQTPLWKDLKFKGFIDVVLYNKKEDKYIIMDLKTARSSWSDKMKKDESKRLQLILYKYLFAIEKEIKLEQIDVHFLILKKHIYKGSQFRISRMQQVKVPNANRTVAKYTKWIVQILEGMNKIVENNEDGDVNPLAKCNWCPYKGVLELCDRKKQLKILRERTKMSS